MAKKTETEIGAAVMRALATEPNGEASVRRLIQILPNFIELSAEDRQPSMTREGEQMWEQQVRNLQSHHGASGNVIAEGFVERVAKAQYRLTPSGWAHIKGTKAA